MFWTSIKLSLFILSDVYLYANFFVMVQPVYGFASGDPLRFKRAVGHTDLFYIDDKDLDFKDVSCFYFRASVHEICCLLYVDIFFNA